MVGEFAISSAVETKLTDESCTSLNLDQAGAANITLSAQSSVSSA